MSKTFRVPIGDIVSRNFCTVDLVTALRWANDPKRLT